VQNSSSTLQQHPKQNPAATPCSGTKQHLAVASSSGTLQPHQHAAPKSTHHSDSSTPKQHPAAAPQAEPCSDTCSGTKQHLAVAPSSGTLQRHLAAAPECRSKAHTPL